MKNELISIIIPVYNTEKYIDRCLLSVINQTYTNLEIILIDDGSTDTSKEKCLAYQKKDKRIKYYRIVNSGASGARNYGLKKASGKYIGFVDSDDVIDKDMFLILYNNLIKTSSDISICEVTRFKDNPIFTNTNQRMIYSPLSILKIILMDKMVCNYSVNKLYKKELLKNICYPLNKVQEDVGTVYKFICNAKRIVYTDSNLYGYYTRYNSVTRKLNSKFIYDYFEMIEKRKMDLKEYNIDNYLMLNEANVILGIFIDLSENKELLKDDKLDSYMNNKLIKLRKLYKNSKRLNTTKHNFLIKILLLNKNLFFITINIYLKLKERIYEFNIRRNKKD